MISIEHNQFSFYSTIVFCFPPWNKGPIPQNTKGIIRMNKKIFAKIEFENLLIILNILIKTILFYCYIIRYSNKLNFKS